MRNNGVEFCPNDWQRAGADWANRSATAAARGRRVTAPQGRPISTREGTRADPYEVPRRAPGRPKIAKESHAGSPSLRIDSRASATATASGRPELKAR